jgi:ADP-heptose:LPS heptosyltransferase
MTEELEHPIISQTESIKLIKGSKAYQWEIKLLGSPEEQLERLEKINEGLKIKYGGQNE